MSSLGVGTGRLSDDQRQAIFAEQLQQATARGLRLESQIRFQAVLVEGRPISHTLHLALAFFTVGIWGIVWAVMVKRGGEKVHQLVVDEFGNVQWSWRPGGSAWRDFLEYVSAPEQDARPTFAASRFPSSTLPPAPPPGAKCPMEKDKRVFATRADAQCSVQDSRRYAAGEVDTKLDHEYRCPYYDHWHVSSQTPRW